MTEILSHAVSGEGPPLLLLNGGLMSYPAWEPLAGPLAASCRLVRCDFRGQLLSPGDAPATLAGHADDLLRLLDAIQIESAHVAGRVVRWARRHYARRAGAVARAIAHRDERHRACHGGDHRARGAVAHGRAPGDAGWRWRPGARSRRADHLVAQFRAAQSAALAARRQAVSLLPRTWFAGLEQLMASLENLDLTPLLPLITCPTLVVGGDADVTFPVAALTRARRRHFTRRGSS